METLSENQNRILNYINNGIPIREIANEKGVSDKAIYKTIRKLEDKGLLIRKKKEPQLKLNKEGYLERSIKGKYYLVHRLIWEDIKGPIPKGYVIHHIDFNKKNNDINNLMCLRMEDHLSLHHKLRKRLPSLTKEILKEIKGVA